MDTSNLSGDLTGRTFGRWLVECEDESRPGYWICTCSCMLHTRRSVVGSNLTRGISRSCGCLRDNAAHERAVQMNAGLYFSPYFNGVPINMRKMSLACGISADVIRNRIKRGWTVLDAITTPTKYKHKP